MTAVPRIARIAIVAGTALSAALVEQFSARADWDCHEAPTLEALQILACPPPDLLIIDAPLCVEASPEALDWLRASGSPIILIGAGDHVPELHVLAHLPRPFRLAGLFDCVQAALGPSPPGWKSLPPTGLCLTEKEAAIFARLAVAEGRGVARTELLTEVWGYGPGVATRTLETHIGRLRRKLAASDSPWRVLSASGGYRLVDSTGSGAEISGDQDRNPLG